MAFLAQKYGGLILSTDPKSFLSYKDHKFQVFESFDISKGGKLTLTKVRAKGAKVKQGRSIPDTLPETHEER